MEAIDERWRWRVEKFVGNAIDAGSASGRELLPLAPGDDFFEGDAASGSAPGGKDDVGLGGGDSFRGRGCARCAEEAASGDFNEFGDPGLGVDERFAPLLAVDEWAVRYGFGAGADGVDGRLHGGDDGLAFLGDVQCAGDEADVGVDVGEGVGREREDGVSGF